MRVIIAAEILLTIGILLFSFSIFIFSLIIRRLLKIIKKRGIWLMLIIGSVFLLLGAIVHFYKLIYYFPTLATSTPYELLPLIVGSMKAGSLEALMILIAGIFTIVTSLIYFKWTTS